MNFLYFYLLIHDLLLAKIYHRFAKRKMQNLSNKSVINCMMFVACTVH
jgi:hypothetical protein